MRSDWLTKTLKEVCSKIGSGATPKGGKSSYLDNGPIALIRSQNIHNNLFSYNGLVYINHKQAKKLSNVIVEPNDILLNITGDSVARCTQVDSNILPARVNQHVSILRAQKEYLHYKYLRYFLLSPVMQNRMLSFAESGGTRNALTKGMIENFEIPLPPLPEQRRIAALLGALDDKIELNRKMNQTLEEMAQAIFKSWFIDFDGVPEEELVESELGLIPRGWEVDVLENCMETIIDHRGRTPKKLGSDWSSEGIPVLSAKHIKAGKIVNVEKLKYITSELHKKWMPNPLSKHDILMTSEAPLGEMYYYDGHQDYCLGQRLFAMRTSSILDSYFFYQWMLSDKARHNLRSRASGSTVLGIRQSELRLLKILIPPLIKQQGFSTLCTRLFQQKSNNTAQSQTLAELRDTLLPKLISGELRIPEAEEQVTDALS